ISELFEQLEAAAGTADPRWLQARWARVLEAARPLTPEGGPAAPQEESAAPGPLALESPAGAVGSLRRSQRARVPSGRARDGPQSAGGKRRSPSGAPPARVRSIVVPLHGARAGRNPSTRPRPAGERGEASPHPAPSSSLGRRAAVRSTAVGRPGDVPAGGSTRRRETTRAESAGKRSRPQSAGARRRSRGGDVRRRSRCSGRAARAQRESSESSGTGVSTDESSETAAGVPGTSEDPSSADESADGLGPFSSIGADSGGYRDPLPGASLESGLRAVRGLLSSSLAPSTWSAYRLAWREWESWLREIGGAKEGRQMVEALLGYIGSLAAAGASVAKVDRALAGIAFGYKWRGGEDVTKHFLVRQALRGFRKGKVRKDTRRPVSFQLLGDIGGVLGNVCSSEYEVRLFRLAFSWAFFGALRVGELVSPSKVREGGIRWEDVQVKGNGVEFWIRRSKTDQNGKGKRVVLGTVKGTQMCPVVTWRRLAEVSVGGKGPALRHSDGSYLSRYQFTVMFRKCLRSLGVAADGFSPHSFRIGAATEAVQRGLSAEVVKKIGRWKSDRYRSYVRPHL
ncbi:hypothetical protein PRIEUP_LOCUS5868, partial [Pristimantis euphronides]